ncbi:hypothetical protein [Flavobacterium sp. F52]|uniref:hypothetical protein n=1 Tax=Flavobacterium sp. F52 TaxID=1202532 RepID=UPI000272E83E|nr:hypothetical protein [Flavobacterium sp. F52]EJF99008.1 hypothetical protein FF52_22929 [Flavobacterium sp. F52]
MEFNQNHTGKITPEKALKMLTDEGMDVTLAQTAEILSFLRLIAGISVKKILEDPETNKITKEEEALHESLENKNKKIKIKSPYKKITYCKTCNFLNNNF